MKSYTENIRYDSTCSHLPEGGLEIAIETASAERPLDFHLKCRAIDVLRLPSFKISADKPTTVNEIGSPRLCLKRKRLLKVDHVKFHTEWKSALR